jgi:hypothetical protein
VLRLWLSFLVGRADTGGEEVTNVGTRDLNALHCDDYEWAASLTICLAPQEREQQRIPRSELNAGRARGGVDSHGAVLAYEHVRPTDDLEAHLERLRPLNFLAQGKE